MSTDCQWVTRTVTVTNRQGLHARPVMKFVDLASQFEAAIHVQKDGETVDGKSPMELMLLEGIRGTQLTIMARGQDATAAIDALVDLVTRGFDED